MTRPRNTRDEIIPIPALHGVHLPGAIEAQEATGGTAMAAGDCTVIPAKGYSEPDLAALGFKLGAIDPSDRLFREATLPPGWKRDNTGHSMHTDILDELGRKRIGIFYKAAWYDRRADLSIVTVHGYVRSCLYKDQPPVLDDVWATRDAVLAALAQMEEREREDIELWTGRSEDYARRYEQEGRERVAKVEALRAALAGAS